MPDLKFPAPYFGGKSTVAHLVWDALGQPKHYIEPFCGSGAVLLARPNYDPQQHTESVNDKDAWLANVWRALKFNPDEVAEWCDWPVNHCDLTARKKCLIKNEGYLIEGLTNDPEWYDAKLAGYWIWAASCWIGSGLTRLGQIPRISDAGMGINGLGQRPHISHAGMGINGLGQRPHISNAGMGEPFNTNLYIYFRQLQERLRYVRVVCGEWHRVCGGDWQDKIGDVGFFFDPPYGVSDRDTTIYHHDSIDVAGEVMEWCRERGKRETYRIVLAGYEEYQELLSEGWTMKSWTATGGYSNKEKNENRKRETLYFSPHCITSQSGLFDAVSE